MMMIEIFEDAIAKEVIARMRKRERPENNRKDYKPCSQWHYERTKI